MINKWLVPPAPPRKKTFCEQFRDKLPQRYLSKAWNFSGNPPLIPFPFHSLQWCDQMWMCIWPLTASKSVSKCIHISCFCKTKLASVSGSGWNRVPVEICLIQEYWSNNKSLHSAIFVILLINAILFIHRAYYFRNFSMLGRGQYPTKSWEKKAFYAENSWKMKNLANYVLAKI